MSGDECHERLDRDLFARAQIHRLGAVETLGGQDDRFSSVLHVKKLARRAPIAPDLDETEPPYPPPRTHLLMSAGMTWLDSGSQIVPGPSRFVGSRKMELKPYSDLYA
jgi:hypothetical protein